MVQLQSQPLVALNHRTPTDQRHKLIEGGMLLRDYCSASQFCSCKTLPYFSAGLADSLCAVDDSKVRHG